MVIANFKLKLKMYIRKDMPLKADILKLKDHETCQSYKIESEMKWKDSMAKNKSINQEAGEVDDDWRMIKSVTQETTDEILGRAKRVQRPTWPSLQTLELADERRNFKRKRRENVETSKHYHY